MNLDDLKPGTLISHFKHPDLLYKVIGIGKHSETLEEMVIYQATFKSEEWAENQIWVRPINMFLDNKEIDGKTVPRFTIIK
jgi:hypothetical protein